MASACLFVAASEGLDAQRYAGTAAGGVSLCLRCRAVAASACLFVAASEGSEAQRYGGTAAGGVSLCLRRRAVAAPACTFVAASQGSEAQRYEAGAATTGSDGRRPRTRGDAGPSSTCVRRGAGSGLVVVPDEGARVLDDRPRPREVEVREPTGVDRAVGVLHRQRV